MPQHPMLLEPGHVADFPQRRIDDFELGPKELVIVQIGNELQGPGPYVNRVIDQLGLQGAGLQRS